MSANRGLEPRPRSRARNHGGDRRNPGDRTGGCGANEAIQTADVSPESGTFTSEGGARLPTVDPSGKYPLSGTMRCGVGSIQGPGDRSPTGQAVQAIERPTSGWSPTGGYSPVQCSNRMGCVFGAEGSN